MSIFSAVDFLNFVGILCHSDFALLIFFIFEAFFTATRFAAIDIASNADSFVAPSGSDFNDANGCFRYSTAKSSVTRTLEFVFGFVATLECTAREFNHCFYDLNHFKSCSVSMDFGIYHCECLPAFSLCFHKGSFYLCLSESIVCLNMLLTASCFFLRFAKRFSCPLCFSFRCLEV